MTALIRRLGCVSAVLAVGGIAYAIPPHVEVARDRRSAPPILEPTAGKSCPGGVEGPIAADLAADRIVTNKGKDTLYLRLDTTPHARLKGTARVRHVMEIVDDTGKAVRAPQTSAAPIALDSSNKGLALPAVQDLADGYYQVRVTVAVKGGNEQGMESYAMPIAVKSGRIQLLDESVWANESRANHEVPTPAGFVPSTRSPNTAPAKR